jgi:dephospho-CoA kinase
MNCNKNGMKIIGLSGGIASGKNTVADIFHELKIEVFDADAVVHNLYLQDQEIIKVVAQNFLESFDGKIINRKILSALISKNPSQIHILEKIIHPKIREIYQNFLEKNLQKKSNFVVINIPLLLESNQYKTDKIIAIIADEKTRQNRYIQRVVADLKNSNSDLINELKNKFLMLKNKQISDEERIKKADFVIYNDADLADLKQKTLDVYQKLIHEFF